jgi:hypothetical protein
VRRGDVLEHLGAAGILPPSALIAASIAAISIFAAV